MTYDEMALQENLSIHDAKQQNLHIVVNGQQQQAGLMPVGHVLSGYAGTENTQANIRVSIVPALMPNQPAIVSSNAHMNTLQVSPSVSNGAGQNVGALLIHETKEEHGSKEQERRIRREIANSNERRRMQSINAGFKLLKSILPHTEGEKLSKAAILQQTSEYISQLESDKIRLMQQNEKLRRAFTECTCNPTKRRTLADIFEKDEGIGSPAEEDYEDMKRGMADTKKQLDQERRTRIFLEEQVRQLETHITYPNGIQSKKLQSADKHQTSVDCIDSNLITAVAATSVGKAQACARPLLPPLAPLAKSDSKYECQLTAVKNSRSPEATLGNTSSLVITSKISSSGNNFDGADGQKPSSLHENSVTVFSHSSNSNQPLKKRAIEIVEVQQNSSSDSGCDATTQQPKAKVAKMSTNSQSSKLSMENSVHTTSQTNDNTNSRDIAHEPADIQAHDSVQRTMPLPALALSLPDPKIHLPPLSSPSTLQGFPSTVYKTMIPQCDVIVNAVNPVVPVMQPGTEADSSAGIATEANSNTNSVPHPVVSISNRKHSQDGNVSSSDPSTPLYFTVRAPNLAYIQQDGDKYVPLPQNFQAPQYIVAPLSNTGNGSTGPTLVHGNPSLQVITPQAVVQQHTLSVQIPPAIISYPTVQVTQTAPTIAPQNSFTHCVNQGTATRPRAFVGNSAVNLGNTHQGPSPKQAVLGYSQPELTLNQLNAVPNLAPPKSLHQTILSLPIASSLTPSNGSDSPSYIMQNYQENILQHPRISTFVNPAALRCRNSSLSATDSCAESGAEEDDNGIRARPTDEVDGRYTESPLAKTSRSSTTEKLRSSTSSLLVDSSSVAAYDEIALENGSTPDKTMKIFASGSDQDGSPDEKTLSVLTNVKQSPPVMRQIDAIQTRCNLETIVQAIDHLEQQERRNSQDQPDLMN